MARLDSGFGRTVLYALASLVAVLGLAAALLYWFLSGDGIRLALEQQASRWLGQPVQIGRATAALFPRVGLRLHEVTAGDPRRLSIARMDLSTNLRALLGRRIEDAEVVVSGGRAEMPLSFGIPPTGIGGTAAAAAAIVSIRSIALEDVTIASRGREITLSAASSLDGTRLTITRLTATARDTVLTARGTVDLAPALTATIQATANQLDFDDLLALAAAFTAGAAPGAPARPRANITASIASPRARLAGVPVTRFDASVLADGSDVRVEPLKFDVFGGRYDGWLDASFGELLDVRIGAGVSNIDVAQLASFGGAPGAISGRLYGSGRFGVRGATMAEALGRARGVGEATISGGTVQNLELLRTVVDFLGGRMPARPAPGERFESIAATFALADGAVRSDDFTLRAPDFDVFARGTLSLRSKALDARADLVLSEALSAQAGRDLYRFTRSGNRIVLPAVLTGTLGSPRVRIDAGAAARRGLQNEIERRLQDLFERVKPPG